MTFDELVRDTLREQADSTGPAPADLAGRVLARRARRRTRGFTAAAVVAVVAISAAVVLPTAPGRGHGHDDQVQHQRQIQHDKKVRQDRQKEQDKQDLKDLKNRLADIPAATGVESHPSQSPPRDRIAAGDQVLAAYYSTRNVSQPGHDVIRTRTYSLLDPSTGRYTQDTRWSDVVVFPGLRTAAVLEQALPAHRVGILDLGTGKVTRWIPVPQGAGGMDLSPDGSKLVVTTYDKNPDWLFWARRVLVNDSYQPQPDYSRTGFAVVDLPSGASQWHALAPDTSMPGSIVDTSGYTLRFSADGTLLVERQMKGSRLVFHRLDGTTAPAPAKERYEDPDLARGGLSPDGSLLAGGYAGEGAKTATEVLDPPAGKRFALQRGQQLLAWADDFHLIAWDIPSGADEFGSRLVLVTVGSDKEVALTGVRHTKQEDSPARWDAVFAHR